MSTWAFLYCLMGLAVVLMACPLIPARSDSFTEITSAYEEDDQ